MLDQDCEASFKPLLVATGIRERRQPVYDSFHAVDGGSLTPVGPSRPGTRLDFWTNSVVRTDFIPIPNLFPRNGRRQPSSLHAMSKSPDRRLVTQGVRRAVNTAASIPFVGRGIRR
jgi:hypothetical protein